MSRIKTIFTNKFMLIPPVLLGIAILVLAIKSQKEPNRQDVAEVPYSVRVVAALQTQMTPRAVGYGVVQPGRMWRGIAEVGGKVVELNPAFETGALLEQGAVLLKIDPLEYDIAVTRANAQIQGVTAQLKELELEQENVRLSLDLEKQNLSILERDFRRNLALVSEGSISETVMEQTEREVLRQKLQVLSLSNNLSLLPIKEDQLKAQLLQNQAQLEDARRRLAQTIIRMPYEGRIAVRNVELGQAVAPGSVIVEVDGIKTAEIEVGLALDKMSGLIANNPIHEGQIPTPEVFHQMGLSAIVRLKAMGEDAVWQAQFSRISAGLDSGARTVGVIVSVKDSYRMVQPGKRPPLVKGMLCEVEVRGPARNAILIPRSALHSGKVYLVDSDNRLEIREVTVGAVQTAFAEITQGLAPGERVVVSDLAPAVNQMLLNPISDEAVRAGLEREALGEGGVR